MHRAAAGWEDAIYNLSRPHKSLRIDMTGPWEDAPLGRTTWKAMEETHARNGGWAHRSAHRSGVVGPKAAPDRPDHQHVIGPPPLAKAPLNPVSSSASISSFAPAVPATEMRTRARPSAVTCPTLIPVLWSMCRNRNDRRPGIQPVAAKSGPAAKLPCHARRRGLLPAKRKGRAGPVGPPAARSRFPGNK